MRITIKKSENYFLENTEISNIFIKTLMPLIKGEHIKVYMLASMYASIGEIVTNDKIAEELSLSIEEVLSAWSSFEKLGLVKKRLLSENESTIFDVEFLDLRSMMFLNSKTVSDSDNGILSSARSKNLDDKKIKAMFMRIEKAMGKPLSSVDLGKIRDFLDELNLRPEVIAKAFEYSKSRGTSVATQYVSKILIDWDKNELETESLVEDYLARTDYRVRTYRKLAKALGLPFTAITQSEKDVFDQWLDEYALSFDDIMKTVDKAVGRTNKFLYVKAILESEHGDRDLTEKGKKTGKSSRNTGLSRTQFYEGMRISNEKVREERQKEIYEKIPEIRELDSKIIATNMEFAQSFSMATGRKKLTEDLKKRIAKLQNQRALLLEEQGYSADYTDMHYSCNKCGDTGTKEDGTSCDCFLRTKGME